MLEQSGPSTVRRMVAGACLITAPLVLVAGDLIYPSAGEAGFVEVIAANLGRVEVANLLIIASSVLFVPALMGILSLVRVRGVTLVHIGVGLMLVGVVGHAVWAGAQIVLAALIRGNVDSAQLAAAVEGGGGPPSAALVVILLMFLIGFFLGLLVLAAGLWRSQAVRRWIPAGLAIVAVTVGISDFVPAAEVVTLLGGAVMIVCFGAMAMKLFAYRET